MVDPVLRSTESTAAGAMLFPHGGAALWTRDIAADQEVLVFISDDECWMPSEHHAPSSWKSRPRLKLSYPESVLFLDGTPTAPTVGWHFANPQGIVVLDWKGGGWQHSRRVPSRPAAESFTADILDGEVWAVLESGPHWMLKRLDAGSRASVPLPPMQGVPKLRVGRDGSALLVGGRDSLEVIRVDTSGREAPIRAEFQYASSFVEIESTSSFVVGTTLAGRRRFTYLPGERRWSDVEEPRATIREQVLAVLGPDARANAVVRGERWVAWTREESDTVFYSSERQAPCVVTRR